jgi:hypothetical protein
LSTEEQLNDEVEVKNIRQVAWENTPEITCRTKGNNYPKTLSQKKEKLEENGISLKHQLVNNATQQLKREIQCIKN